jgi:hypothetical protein
MVRELIDLFNRPNRPFDLDCPTLTVTKYYEETGFVGTMAKLIPRQSKLRQCQAWIGLSTACPLCLMLKHGCSQQRHLSFGDMWYFRDRAQFLPAEEGSENLHTPSHIDCAAGLSFGTAAQGWMNRHPPSIAFVAPTCALRTRRPAYYHCGYSGGWSARFQTSRAGRERGVTGAWHRRAPLAAERRREVSPAAFEEGSQSVHYRMSDYDEGQLVRYLTVRIPMRARTV